MAGESKLTPEQESAKQLHDELLPQMPAGTHDGASCGFCSPNLRETAAEGASVAGESTTVNLEDPAILAVVKDRVERETAELRVRAETAEKERDETKTRLDVVEAEKAAAAQERDAAKTELDTLKTTVETEKAAAERVDGRIAALREVASLPEDFFTGDQGADRTARVGRMSDEDFESWKAEMAAAAPKKPDDGKGGGAPPRETAMATAGGAPNGGAAGGGGKPATERASARWIGATRTVGRQVG